jgi:hypothetical protein
LEYLDESAIKMAVRPDDERIVALGTESAEILTPDFNLYFRVSNDFGITWSSQQVFWSGDDILTGAAIEVDSVGNFWVVITLTGAVSPYPQSFKLYKSGDGYTWNLIKTQVITDNEMFDVGLSISGNNIYIEWDLTPIRVAHSSDGGLNFSITNIGATYPSYPRYNTLGNERIVSNGDVVIVCAERKLTAGSPWYNVLLRSADGGATFSEIYVFSVNASSYFPSLYASGSKFIFTSPYMGVNGTLIPDQEKFGILYSSDNGLTWTMKTGPDVNREDNDHNGTLDSYVVHSTYANVFDNKMVFALREHLDNWNGSQWVTKRKYIKMWMMDLTTNNWTEIFDKDFDGISQWEMGELRCYGGGECDLRAFLYAVDYNDGQNNWCPTLNSSGLVADVLNISPVWSL